MQYVGIQKQIRRNNFNSLLLLVAFPMILLAMTYLFFLFFTSSESDQAAVRQSFTSIVPFILAGTAIWFVVAWLFHTAIIKAATGAHSLERKDNKRVYNLLENLCIAQGIRPPRLYVIDDSSLNAFASGIGKGSYAISLSRGIIDKLNDEELEGVIAHELTHIQNRDVRLLIISVIFVGIFAFIAEIAFRSLFFSGSGRSRDGKSNAPIILLAVVISSIAYLISILLRFGISRSREYMADAGAAELTRNPRALASALRKISGDPLIEAIRNRDVAQMFIDNPTPPSKKFSFKNLFATHPPIEKRIELLERFT